MKTLIGVIILALIAGGIYMWVGRDDSATTPETNQNQAGNDAGTNTGTNTGGLTGSVDVNVGTQLATREFTVSGKNFSFTPASMQVNKGERVRITFVNEAGTHDLVVDGYNVRTKILQGGQSETIEFIASASGTFEYYCSVGSHRQMGMKGTLTVKE